MLRELKTVKLKIQSLNIGIKNKKDDAVCFEIPRGSKTSIVSTKNKFAAAPIIFNKKNIKNIKPRYLFINSGNANACTGKEGYSNLKKYAKKLSGKLNCEDNEILFFSTGIIGEQLPISKILNSIDKHKFPFNSSLSSASRAIMTTDKFPKIIQKRIKILGEEIKIQGICKGAGMIEPNMATMLAFVFIDISVNQRFLRKLLMDCISETFNKISVDGDMSTNDSVVLVSTGENNKIDMSKTINQNRLKRELLITFKDLSLMIIKDGEGATKILEVDVKNALSPSQAKKLCYAIANSNLVKTAIYGEDPNWGRIIAKIGSVENIDFDVKKVKLYLNKILVFKSGIATSDAKSSKLKKSMKQRNIIISLSLGAGEKGSSIITADLTKKYVHINSAYTS